jgi:hypothetical protein
VPLSSDIPVAWELHAQTHDIGLPCMKFHAMLRFATQGLSLPSVCHGSGHPLDCQEV